MILVLRSHVGNALLNVAGVLAKTGRAILGRPTTHLRTSMAKGDQVVRLDRRIATVTEGLRLCGTKCDEIVRVKRVDGLDVTIDRPLAQDYPRGSSVKVLV